MGKKVVSTMLILQILVALLLLAFGIEGLVGYNSTGSELIRGVNKMLGGGNGVLPLVFAIIEVVVGALLIADLFVPVVSRFVFVAMVVICVVWLIGIISAFFSDRFLEPSFTAWLAPLSKELILLFSFYLVGSSKQ